MDSAASHQPITISAVMAPPPSLMETYLQASAVRHAHLCPRQVLGVRLALRALQALGLTDATYSRSFRNGSKQLLTIVETDGCGADGISVVTDCDIGRRTLRVLDFGKLAATLVYLPSRRAVRVAPTAFARDLAWHYAPDAQSRWHAYLEAYQVMPDEELVQRTEVRLTRTIEEILSKPGVRATCQLCQEEIINEREVNRDGIILCRSCAGNSYYSPLDSD
jgi:formylmethanofuran dehydrogenase subunit E